MKSLSDFKDIHTHNLAAGDDSIINLPWGAAVPDDHGYYSVGIHPWDAADAAADDYDTLLRLAGHPRVVAIGETGLDALRGPRREVQERVFRQHVQVSETVGKPLIIHAVRTLSDILRLHRELNPSQQWVVHGFRGKPETARQLISHGIDVSLGKKYHPAMPDGIDVSHIYRETD